VKHVYPGFNVTVLQQLLRAKSVHAQSIKFSCNLKMVTRKPVAHFKWNDPEVSSCFRQHTVSCGVEVVFVLVDDDT